MIKTSASTNGSHGTRIKKIEGRVQFSEVKFKQTVFKNGDGRTISQITG